MILQSLFTAIKLLLISNRTIRFDSVSSSEQNYMAAANGHSYDGDARCKIKKESEIRNYNDVNYGEFKKFFACRKEKARCLEEKKKVRKKTNLPLLV